MATELASLQSPFFLLGFALRVTVHARFYYAWYPSDLNRSAHPYLGPSHHIRAGRLNEGIKDIKKKRA